MMVPHHSFSCPFVTTQNNSRIIMSAAAAASSIEGVIEPGAQQPVVHNCHWCQECEMFVTERYKA